MVYIASRDFVDEQSNGFVDYIGAFRSPGSTLKPFIYGLGFDLGLVKPDTYVLDERRRFGAYYPRNFDKDIHGVVKVQEALSMSLNIPVVALLNQIGVVRFLGLLKEAGISPQFPKSFESPSLAVALGGMGMTLEQLVTLYAGLARDGKIMPLSYIESNELAQHHQLFSAFAAQQVTTILSSDNDNSRKIAMKTGTSYGHRDALVIGYDERYVVGIWTGMPDGTPMGEAAASTLVVPLLKKVFNVLPKNAPQPAQYNAAPTIRLKNLSQSHDHDVIAKEAPTLLFPIDDTVIELEKSGEQFKALPLSVNGGKRPYTWLIDGKPISQSSWQQKHFWTPQKLGYYTIAVVDANGKVDRANIELR